MKQIKFILIILTVASLSSCKDKDVEENVDPTPTTDQEIIEKYLTIDLENLDNYTTVSYPVHYDADVLATDNQPATNEVTDMGATLGRVLFYDKGLSINNTVSCASCHIQDEGFVDPAKLSEGFEGGLTGAHSMRLANVRFYQGESMFWDKRAATLEDQATQPIQDGVEMGFDEAHGGFSALIDKMDGLEYYPILFEKTFGSSEITEGKVQMALAQFMRSMVSVNSKFDEGFAQVYNANAPGNGIGANFPNYTNEENAGKQLFLAPPNNGGAGCAGCHQPPTFSLDPNSRSNGLTAGEQTIFKSPSLKNVGITGPYMHDGSLETLADVVEHYNSGVQIGPSLDGRLRTAPPIPQPVQLNLNQNQKDALVAFLQTLDDPEIVADARFSNPFVN